MRLLSAAGDAYAHFLVVPESVHAIDLAGAPGAAQILLLTAKADPQAPGHAVTLQRYGCP